jgi:hypothetical protein
MERAAVGNRTVTVVAVAVVGNRTVAVVGELSLVEINGGTCLLSTEFLLHCRRHIDAEPRYISPMKGGETSSTTYTSGNNSLLVRFY